MSKLLHVLLPSAVIGSGVAVGAVISVPAGIMLIGAGVAIIAFSKTCLNLEQTRIPVTHQQHQM